MECMWNNGTVRGSDNSHWQIIRRESRVPHEATIGFKSAIRMTVNRSVGRDKSRNRGSTEPRTWPLCNNTLSLLVARSPWINASRCNILRHGKQEGEQTSTLTRPRCPDQWNCNPRELQTLDLEFSNVITRDNDGLYL